MIKRLQLLLLAVATLLVSSSVGAFAFFVTSSSNPQQLGNSDRGQPVIWKESSVAIGINVNSAPYRQAVLEVMSHWNSAGAEITLVEGMPLSSACSHRDGLNNLEVAESYCGAPWGDALGFTVVSAQSLGGETVLVEADTLLRSFVSDPTSEWSVDGADPRLPVDTSCYGNSRGGVSCDFPRVVLHELGHAMGLSHPDELGQQVTAVMNSGKTSTVVPKQLATDDIEGLKTLYQQGRGAIDGTAGLTTNVASSDSDSSGGGGGGLFAVGLLFLLMVRLLWGSSILGSDYEKQ
ncbi:MAG: hypothetical protein FD130_2093 [Halothiobacillaceae bacterium]|nr:MAG: hypothetical protein FD130_2093 [Halothiobacillaceae bacterium]